MTHEDIEDGIAAGEITAITLDTSTFGNPSEMTLEHGLIKRLEQFKTGLIRLMLADVVVQELTGHLGKGAASAAADLTNALKRVGNSWNIPREKRDEARTSLLGAETPAEHAQRRIASFVERTGCQILEVAAHAKVDDLVRRYFSHAAPFADKETKKYEFPDALALLALEGWAQEAKTKMLVVSKDGDWLRFCRDSEHLVIVPQLVDALSLFHKGASVASCKVLSERLQSGEYAGLERAIEKAIENHVEGMYFMPEAYSGFGFYIEEEFTDVEIKNFSIGHNLEELTPVDAGDDYLVAEILVSTEIEITSEFSFSTTDSIDKDQVPMGSTSLTTTETLELTAIVTFGGDIPHAPTIDDVEIEGSNRHDVFFGEIEPNWMREPPDPE